MSITDWIAMAALLVSFGSFIISFFQNRHLANENIRLQEAAHYQQRNFEFESKLSEWPEVYRFFGIDIEKVKKEEGISQNQITYLVLSIHALHSYCRASGESIYKHMKSNDYRQRLFANRETRLAWKYARLMFSDYIRKGIDQYLQEHPIET
jgi:hypothetical protein